MSLSMYLKYKAQRGKWERWIRWNGIIEPSQVSVKSLYFQRPSVDRWNILVAPGRGFVEAKLERGKPVLGDET